jgi:hypothetical protein
VADPRPTDALASHSDVRERLRRLELGREVTQLQVGATADHPEPILEWLYRGAGQVHPDGLGQVAAALWRAEQVEFDGDVLAAIRDLRIECGLMPGPVRWRHTNGEWRAGGTARLLPNDPRLWPDNRQQSLQPTAQEAAVSQRTYATRVGPLQVVQVTMMPAPGRQPKAAVPGYPGRMSWDPRWGWLLNQHAQATTGDSFGNPHAAATTYREGNPGIYATQEPYGEGGWGLTWRFAYGTNGTLDWRWFHPEGNAYTFADAPEPYRTTAAAGLHRGWVGERELEVGWPPYDMPGLAGSTWVWATAASLATIDRIRLQLAEAWPRYELVVGDWLDVAEQLWSAGTLDGPVVPEALWTRVGNGEYRQLGDWLHWRGRVAVAAGATAPAVLTGLAGLVPTSDRYVLLTAYGGAGVPLVAPGIVRTVGRVDAFLPASHTFTTVSLDAMRWQLN